MTARCATRSPPWKSGFAGLAPPEQADTGWPADIKRIADHFDPPPPDIVDTAYVANRLGYTLTWIADLVRQGEIPRGCVVKGTGNGKPWKFHRHLIDQWIEAR